jgi:amino acid permease
MASEKLTTKKVLLIVVLILMAYAFIYIGANVSWLAFLPTVGVAILLSIIYWEKREHEPELTTLERVTA